MNLNINYCSYCGADQLAEEIPAGDNMPRIVCSQCGSIHYQNPKIVAGCLVTWQDQVLLCRRAIEPRYGLWTMPAGFMENNESIEEAACRETFEEAQARVTLDGLYGFYSIPRISHVYVLFRGHLDKQEFGPGSESLEVKLFSEAEIPWDDLAFNAVRVTLRHYFNDRKRGEFPLHLQTL
ncbi:NUDIX hydrolase [Candidatus Venteria ishoeyi]|uniref:NUDIX hydrolase n=1 Tax=Candidatus Venteria ishoeyi TaxID=1899563 RepID=UPI0025A8E7CF|nr:NUDIX hydrolase [Candidatus Venteria ishoeyi]